MYLTFTDETNRNESDSKFFLVGGVVIPANEAANLHKRISEIRTTFGYRPEDSLKYSRADKPKHIDNSVFNNAKSNIIDLCANHSIKIFLYVCHHLIAANKTPEVKHQWGSNAILWKINQYLTTINDHCMVLQDRHPVQGEFDYYKRRFMESQPDYQHDYKLDRVVGFGSTCDGASHLASIADITLGSFRFCINNPDKNIVNRALMPRLLQASWGYPNPIGNGIGIFPAKGVIKPECVEDYQQLRKQLLAFI